jgi:hypothetical protein
MMENNCFIAQYCVLFQHLDGESMFAALYLGINLLKSGHPPITQPNSQKGRRVKVKDGIISETISFDQYSATTL